MNHNLSYRTHMGDWIFRFNTKTKMWEALEHTKVSNTTPFLMGNTEKVLRSSDINTLIEVINKKLYETL